MRLIDADKIKYTANGCFHPHCKEGNCDVCCHAVVRKGKIDIIPTVEAEPVKHAHWEKAQPKGCVAYSDAYKQCSFCKEVQYGGDRMKYCPNCGVKMNDMD